MPVVHKFEGSLFRLECTGESTPLEVMNGLEAALWDPAFPRDARLLMDVRHSASVSQQSHVELLWLSGVIGSRSKRFGKRCAVLAPVAMLETLAHIGQAFAPDFGAEARIFAEEAEALAWLGVPAQEPQTVSSNS